MDAWRELLRQLGWPDRGADADLLVQALTHPSFAHEQEGVLHNESLAFLGDAVLGLVVAEVLWEHVADDAPGPLSQRRAELVSTRGLARWALGLDLGRHLRLGRGEALTGGREKESILASALEAVVAALYLQGGLPPVRRLVSGLLAAGPTTA